MASEECCKGTVHAGKPVGRVETLYDVPCYVSDPPEGAPPKAIIVILPDAFGWELNNARLLADTFARRCEMRVLLPDMMNGESMDKSLIPTMEAFADPTKSFFSRALPGVKAMAAFIPFSRRQSPENVWPRVTAFLGALRDSTPDLRLGLAGYCWGGKFVFMAAADQTKSPQHHRSLIDAGFTAHPSRLKLPAEAEAVAVPVSVAIGSLDIVAGPKEADLMRAAWEKKGTLSPDGCEVQILEGAKHGFGIRADVGKEEERKLYEASNDQAVNFFSRILVKKT